MAREEGVGEELEECSKGINGGGCGCRSRNHGDQKEEG